MSRARLALACQPAAARGSCARAASTTGPGAALPRGRARRRAKGCGLRPAARAAPAAAKRNSSPRRSRMCCASDSASGSEPTTSLRRQPCSAAAAASRRPPSEPSA
eukprot:7891665-Pyramimonas_sp.AAC.1